MTRLPAGFRLVSDRSLRCRLAGHVLIGGVPVRALRLTDAGSEQAERLLRGELVDQATAGLARRLVDAGLAHPRPPQADAVSSIEVAIPVRDRPLQLERCLRALGGGFPVTVIDDGSADPQATAEVCERNGATLLRIAPGRGPSAARNLALAHARSELIAFIDSDVVATPQALQALASHFADPDVGVVAPRVRPLTAHARTLLERYALARSPLDMGAAESVVRPGARVPYVPTAALLVRRAGLHELRFDEQLLCGEDVDLVWRLHDAGWRVRYDPRTVVHHDEPGSWPGFLHRRYRYGRSVGPLGRRHHERLAHIVLAPLPAASFALLLVRRPRAAAVLGAVHAVRLRAALRPFGVGPDEALRWSALSVWRTGVGLGTAATQLAAPLLGAALLRRRTRAAAAALLLTAPISEFVSSRPRMNPAAWVAARLADELLYGAGVLAACVTSRTIAPLRPRRAGAQRHAHRHRVLR